MYEKVSSLSLTWSCVAFVLGPEICPWTAEPGTQHWPSLWSGRVTFYLLFSAKARLSLKPLREHCFLPTACVCVRLRLSIYAYTPGCVCVCLSWGKAVGCLYEAEEWIHAEVTNWEIWCTSSFDALSNLLPFAWVAAGLYSGCRARVQLLTALCWHSTHYEHLETWLCFFVLFLCMCLHCVQYPEGLVRPPSSSYCTSALATATNLASKGH